MVDPAARLNAVIESAEAARSFLMNEDSDTALVIYKRALRVFCDDPWESALWIELRDMILQTVLFSHTRAGLMALRKFDERLTTLRNTDTRGSIHYWLNQGLDEEAAYAAAALHRIS